MFLTLIDGGRAALLRSLQHTETLKALFEGQTKRSIFPIIDKCHVGVTWNLLFAST